MSVKKRVDLRCDWPTEGQYSYERTCTATDYYFTSSTVKAREAAARDAGWLRVAEFDFCGAGDPDLSTALPNHAALMAGHTFAAVKRQVPIYDRFQVTCSCGWICPEEPLHRTVYGEPGGLTHSRESAAEIWLELHVREDIARLAPLHSRERLDELRQQREAARAAWQEEWKAHEQTLIDQKAIEP